MNFSEFAQKECPALAQKAAVRAVRVPPPAMPEVRLPQWQEDLCCLHAEFTGSVGKCNRPDCFCDAVVAAEGDPENLTKYEIGHGITCGQIIEQIKASNEPEDLARLLEHPAYFILLARKIHGGDL